jgi:hypothetical protein
MNNSISTNIIRIVLVFLAQVLIFKHVTFGFADFAYIHFIVYPLAFLLLPVKTPSIVVLPLAFLVGIGVDMFYDSPGVHASASVFSAYFRTLVIAFLEPYDGYNVDDAPSIKRLGFGWFVSYISIVLLVHIFFYFSVEAFSFVYFFDIFLNTIFSFIISFIVIIIIQSIFRTKY